VIGSRMIRVMSQNMGRPTRGDGVEALCELVAGTRPQLLLLQQITGLTSQVRIGKLGRALDMEVAVGQISGGGATVLAWDPGWLTLVDGQGSDGLGLADGFGYVAAHLKVAGLKYVEELVVISCHLSRSSAARRRSRPSCSVNWPTAVAGSV
jgi:hypothetical protein